MGALSSVEVPYYGKKVVEALYNVWAQTLQ